MTVLGDLIQQVGGDKVEVKSLVPPGGEVHTYQPAPEDIKTVSQARIVFYNGVHLEDWLEGTIRSAGKPDLPIVLLAKGLPIIQEAGEEPNPHLWMDVTNAKMYVEKIRDGLSKVDSANARYYGERARQYLSQLDELESGSRPRWNHPQGPSQAGDIPRCLPVFRQTLRPHPRGGRRRKPRQGALGPRDRRADPEDQAAAGAGDLRRSPIQPQAHGVLAKDARVRVITSLYDDSLSSGPEANTYIAMMKYDVTQIVNALK